MLLQKKERKKTLLIGSNQLQWVLGSGTEKTKIPIVFFLNKITPQRLLWWIVCDECWTMVNPPPPPKKNSCVKNLLCAIYPHNSASVLVQEDSFSRFTACFLYIMSHCLRFLEIACVEVCIQHARTKFFWGSGYICFLFLSTTLTWLSLILDMQELSGAVQIWKILLAEKWHTRTYVKVFE